MDQQFQFHKGTIRTRLPRYPLHLHPYFNSIKVQLESVRPDAFTPLKKFQFHKGTIRTFTGSDGKEHKAISPTESTYKKCLREE